MLESKVRALLNYFKKNGVINKIYVINSMEDSVSCVVDGLNYNSVTAYLLYRVLKVKQLELTKVEPLNTMKIRLTFKSDNEQRPAIVASCILQEE